MSELEAGLALIIYVAFGVGFCLGILSAFFIDILPRRRKK